ncbi:hypothetical protein AB835_00510 [Candidatus Endobugula sertula]|uniref:Type VI secretion system component TssM1 N-terminal domain-containing protein n=1 Tax=Candidatus Endobugula sertula TaxID=62101 RepID=A0A1D2QTV2_9GAMM|nr:hypothetical protein AB835_00510 [Candidatus Endobugula sertula]
MAESTENQQLQQQFTDLVNGLQTMQVQVVDRVEPLIENTRPIWSDPLWQFLGLILLTVIALLIIFWLLRVLINAFITFVEGSNHLLATVIQSIFKIMRARFKKTESESPEIGTSKASFWFNNTRIKQAFDAVRYLSTRRDWRYRNSWYLLSGTGQSAKDCWIKSIRQGRRTQLMAREKQLIAEGSGWYFFDHGLVIDVEDDDHFSRVVDLITAYRPERPLDGVILTISAKTLLNAQSDSTTFRKHGQDLYQKMWAIQKTTGFVLPVYLMLTECEVVSGFEAFWSSWSEEPSDDMFGWSNPTRIDTAFSIDWVEDAFTSVIGAIRKAQLHIAASGDDIADIDRFMLFDFELQRLQSPLTEVIEHAFARSSFQEALPLRGIWFSGKINGQVALSGDFLAKKIWPETHLAYPMEQRYFSSNKTLRHFQYFSLVAVLLLVIGLGIDTYRLNAYTNNAQKAWDGMFVNKNISRFCSGEGLATWWLLNNLTKLADQPKTLTIPASWWGGQIPAIRSAAADIVYPSMIFSAYECRLKIRAKQLNELSRQDINERADLTVLSDRLSEYIQQLAEYQKAQTRFIRLAGPLPDSKGVAEDLKHLTDYLYDGTIPSSVDFNTPILVGGVMDAHYDIEWNPNDLVDATEQANHLIALSHTVRGKMRDKALIPPLDGIRKAFFVSPLTKSDADAESISLSSTAQMLESIDVFQNWLRYISQEWLHSTPSTSQCGRFEKKLQSLQLP